MAEDIKRDDEVEDDEEELENEDDDEQENVDEKRESKDEGKEERDSGRSQRRSQPYQPQQRRQDSGRRPTGGGGSGGAGGYRRSNYRSRRRGCPFCADKVKVINWKDVNTLRRFVNDTGDMRPRRKTGTCAKHQRRLARAIKRARVVALLPYTSEHVRVQSKY